MKCRKFNNALYVNARVDSIPTACLIDTGSTITVLDARKFHQIPEADRPVLRETSRLKMADGSIVRPLGKAEFIFDIGSKTIKHEMTVADIESQVILGFDFLSKHKCSLDLEKEILRVGNKSIKCNSENAEQSVCRIRVADKVFVPAESEIVIKSFVEGDSFNDCLVLIEPVSTSMSEQGILVARTIAKSKNGFVPLRLINISKQPQILQKNMQAAVCELVDSVYSSEAEYAEINKICVEKVQNVELPEYMEPILRSCDGLSDEQMIRVKQLLAKHLQVFAKSKTDLGRTDLITHKINTGDARPVKQAPRRIPLAKRDAAEKELQRMIECKVIEPSKSPWSANCVLVEKRDKSLRYAVDYRLLNQLSKKDSYPVPRIDDALDALASAKMLSTVDLLSGYWQVAMDPKDKEKTAFSTSHGLYQFRVMPFGVCNGVATFERLMEFVLAGLNWQICLVYLDDIIIFSKDFDSHLSRLDQVLDRIGKAGLKIAPKKCQFFQEKVTFLGHVVSKDGISTDPSKIDAVKEWPVPRNVHDVRSFLGTCSYYRKFIRGFADIARPLHRLTEKQARFEWTQECQIAFNTLRDRMTTAPILSYPQQDCHFILDTDASGFGMGAVLSQLQDGEERVLAYFSKSLSKAERNYCVTRRELLAVVMSIKQFHHYLYGVNFTVRTDHGALTWLMRFKNPEGQIARWLEVLSTYDFEIKHRAGKQHGNADGLSRRPCSECNYCSRQESKDSPLLGSEQSVSALRAVSNVPDNDAELLTWFQSKSLSEISESQNKDYVLSDIINLKETFPSRPKWENISNKCPEIKAYWSLWEMLVLRNKILLLQIY